MDQKFSVLITTYKKDSPSCLEKALDSINNQSLKPNQIVFVVDGEIPNESEKIICDFANKFSNIFTQIKLPVNKGLGNALSEGLKHCEHNLVARMDADDESFYERFQTQIDFLEKNPTVSVVGGFLEEFHASPGDYGKINKAPIGFLKIKKYANFRNPFNHPSVMFRKDAIESVGGYKEINLFEDYYLWLRLLKANYILENMAVCLVHFKVGNDLIGRRHGFSYLKKEYQFLKLCKREELISKNAFLINVFTRMPLRLIPKKILFYIYKFFLRA
jgi:glycosyltransferase involved in cell wall biosynthesis